MIRLRRQPGLLARRCRLVWMQGREQLNENRAAAAQFIQMRLGQVGQPLQGVVREPEIDPTLVDQVLVPLDEARLFQAVGEFRRGVRFDAETLRKTTHRHLLTLGLPRNRKEGLVLPGGQVKARRGGFAEFQKTSYYEPELGQDLIIPVGGDFFHG